MLICSVSRCVYGQTAAERGITPDSGSLDCMHDDDDDDDDLCVQ